MSGKVETKEIYIERAMEQYMISVQACTTHLVANSNRKRVNVIACLYILDITGTHVMCVSVCVCVWIPFSVFSPLH